MLDEVRPKGVVGSSTDNALLFDAEPKLAARKCAGGLDSSGNESRWGATAEVIALTLPVPPAVAEVVPNGVVGDRTRCELPLAKPAEYQVVVVGLVELELGPGSEKDERPACV